MTTRLQLGDIAVRVVLKNIKNVHLTVGPPDGSVRISAPSRMKVDTLRVLAISKLAWIKQQRKKFQLQERETRREYVDRECHYVWGRRCLLAVVESEEASSVELKHSRLVLRVRPGADTDRRHAVLEDWYREQVKSALAPLLAKWEPLLAVKVGRAFVQRMKTKWGSCNPRTRSIRLNTDLAKKPRECLDYIVVHELVHLLEPTHNAQFVALMDRFMPRWQVFRQTLNRLPVRHEHWEY